ncbi:hypothetical protein LguiA_008124 [Lonicera macranthoides]
MVLKRSFAEGSGDGSDDSGRESRRRLATSKCSVLGDVMNRISLQELASRLEPFLRRVIRDQVEQAIQPLRHSCQRSSLNQIEASGETAWRLEFHSRLPSTFFTGSRIESEESESIKIVLIDAISKNIITSGPLSSIKIEIVALDGDFGADDREDWTEEEFNTNIVREREGKRPLVTGELVITLRNGVGYIGDLSFTDNSSWTRSRKFRLGAKVQRRDVRIREAGSEAFVVKDHRGESYKKHHPPSSHDEVWRLERIAKDGKFHQRLAEKGISNVEEVLKLYHSDPSKLRNILGGGISNKAWETIIDHASACVLDDKLYMYCPNGETVSLVFNSVYKVLGAVFGGQNYLYLDKLNVFQMRLVDDLKQKAYKNLNEIVPFDEHSVVTPPLLPSIQANPFSSTPLDLPNFNLPTEEQDQVQMQMGSNHMATSPPYTYEIDDSAPLGLSMAQNSHSMQAFSPTLRNSFIMRDFCYDTYAGGEYSSAPSESLESVMVRGNLAVNDSYLAETSIWHGNRFSFGRNYQSADIFPSNIGLRLSGSGSPKARWCKIRAAFKWGISVRRDVAAKRMLLQTYICR